MTITTDDAVAPHPAATDAHPRDGWLGRRLRPLRRGAQRLLLIGIAAAALFATGLLRGVSPISDAVPGVSPTTDPTASVAAARPTSPSPRLIAPATARPGEHLTIVAFHSREACGVVVLRFDGNPVAHQLTSYVESPDPTWIGMFMTLDTPATATVGIHEIELYVPLDGGRRGPVCGNEPQPVARLASTTVIVQL